MRPTELRPYFSDRAPASVRGTISRTAVALVAGAVITGCSTTDSVMQSWVGQPIDNVTARWGAPDSRIDRDDGGQTYTWTTVSTDQFGVHQCRKTFVTDSQRRVAQWSYANCPKFVRTF